MNVEIRHTQPGDAAAICTFHENGNCTEILQSTINESLECWTGLLDDEVIAIWGVTAPNILSDDVYVWLTGSKLIEVHPLVFARWSRKAIATVEAYPKLHGLVLCDFEVSKRWLRWLGFEVGLPEGKICRFARGLTMAGV